MGKLRLWSGYRNRREAINAFCIAPSFCFLSFPTPTQHVPTSPTPSLACTVMLFQRLLLTPSHRLAHSPLCNGSLGVPRATCKERHLVTHGPRIHTDAQITAAPTASFCSQLTFFPNTFTCHFVSLTLNPLPSSFLTQSLSRTSLLFPLPLTQPSPMAFLSVHLPVATSAPLPQHSQGLLHEAVLELYYCSLSLSIYSYPSN